METRDKLESDWIHSVFEVLREEVVSIAADFGDRVKGEIDQVAASQGIRPPSAAALLAAVAVESGKIATDLVRGTSPKDDEQASKPNAGKPEVETKQAHSAPKQSRED